MITVAAVGLLGVISGVNAVSEHVKNNVRDNFGADKVVHIAHEDLTNEFFNKVFSGLEADHFGKFDTGHHFKLSPEAVEALENANVDFEDTTEEWVKKFEENFADANYACGEGGKCAERDAQSFYSQFQPLAAIHQRVTNLANSVSFASISSIGRSYENRDQLVVNIGDSSKPLVFYFCNIHAREWLPPMYCTYMVENLIANGGHPLLDTFSFTILPSANPDGYVYTWTNNNLWRKTRKPNPGSSCVGVDPNRNYDNRHCGAGTSNSPCSEIYCGPQPWTEIEVRNIRDFALQNQNRLIAMNDVHAKGQMWMHPYGGTTTRPPSSDYNKMFTCAEEAADGIRAAEGRSWDYGTVNEVSLPSCWSLCGLVL